MLQTSFKIGQDKENATLCIFDSLTNGKPIVFYNYTTINFQINIVFCIYILLFLSVIYIIRFIFFSQKRTVENLIFKDEMVRLFLYCHNSC